MILCSCNMITDRDVRASVKPCGAAADRARDVFRAKGCLPRCGRCVRNIQNLCEREAAAKVEGRPQATRSDPAFAIAAE
ncbi:(2Fe-2S)-binding protein [Rhodoblastus sp.]|uniref:(2Fe-2S)-binding protein n=1 Tax=Rhodoblastus sp. TaxID=1962975 RepID=UPI0026297B9F|nr:(2Fe-2S)-binding protein [Rhodoblastus sp.]